MFENTLHPPHTFHYTHATRNSNVKRAHCNKSLFSLDNSQNYKMFDLESCISTITLEKLCELCKHIDSWLGSAREKVVVLQDR